MEKIRTVLAVIIVIGLVFITNRLDKSHFEQVQESLTSIYQDRVLAQDYLYDLSNAFHNRKLRMSEGELVSFENDTEIELLLGQFESTFLTKKEEELFDRLQENYAQMKTLGFTTGGPKEGHSASNYLNRIDLILAELSDIQVQESKSLKVRAQQSLDSNLLISNMEIFLVIFFGLILQYAVFFGGKKKSKKLQASDEVR